MADMDAGTAGVIGAVIGAIGGSVLQPTFNFLLKRRHLDVSQDKGVIRKLETRIEFLEKAERECQKHVLELTSELGSVKGELKAVHQLCQRLEGVSNVAIVTCDTHGKIVAWNSPATTLFHYTQQEALGQHINMLIPGRWKSKHIRAFNAAITSSSTVDSKRIASALTREGAEVTVEISLTSYEDNGAKFFTAEIRKQ